MPFNGSNSFTIVNTFVPATTILSSAVNANFSDIATGLSDCVTRDAQGAVTGNLLFSSTGYMQLPNGTTGQRPVSALAGYLRFNTTTVAPEYYDGTAWDTLGAAIANPGGYLTLTSGTAIITGDVTAATAVYYTPFTGQLCPVYNGTAFVNQVFAEQTLTLTAGAHLASTIYDVFAFMNAGTFTVATGPAWNSSAAGSSSRGTGAGTTQLQRINGFWTNQNSMTAINGSTSYTVAANQGTYLGSIFIDSSAGQISCHRTNGVSRKWGVWNAFNRTPIILRANDPSVSWAGSNTGTIQPAHNSSANSFTLFMGLAEEMAELTLYQRALLTVTTGTGASNQCTIGIGFNSTTTYSGKVGQLATANTSSVNQTQTNDMTASYVPVMSIGINTITALEETVTIGGGITFFGGGSGMVLQGLWRG